MGSHSSNLENDLPMNLFRRIKYDLIRRHHIGKARKIVRAHQAYVKQNGDSWASKQHFTRTMWQVEEIFYCMPQWLRFEIISYHELWRKVQ